MRADIRYILGYRRQAVNAAPDPPKPHTILYQPRRPHHHHIISIPSIMHREGELDPLRKSISPEHLLFPLAEDGAAPPGLNLDN